MTSSQTQDWLVRTRPNLAPDPAFSSSDGFFLRATPSSLHPPVARDTSRALLSLRAAGCFIPLKKVLQRILWGTLEHPSLPEGIQPQPWAELFYTDAYFEAPLAQCLAQFRTLLIFFPTPFLFFFFSWGPNSTDTLMNIKTGLSKSVYSPQVNSIFFVEVSVFLHAYSS